MFIKVIFQTLEYLSRQIKFLKHFTNVLSRKHFVLFPKGICMFYSFWAPFYFYLFIHVKVTCHIKQNTQKTRNFLFIYALWHAFAYKCT